MTNIKPNYDEYYDVFKILKHIQIQFSLVNRNFAW